jgi:hypothetical protein
MEPLWSPVVATGGNPSQIATPQKPQKYAKTVAVRCDWLPFAAHGKGRVDATSLFAKEGVSFLAPQEVESHRAEGPAGTRARLASGSREVGVPSRRLPMALTRWTAPCPLAPVTAARFQPDLLFARAST